MGAGIEFSGKALRTGVSLDRTPIRTLSPHSPLTVPGAVRAEQSARGKIFDLRENRFHMAKRSPQTQAKRQREFDKARKRQEKLEKRVLRKAQKSQEASDAADTAEEDSANPSSDPSESAPSSG